MVANKLGEKSSSFPGELVSCVCVLRKEALNLRLPH